MLLVPTEIRSWNGATKVITGAWHADSLRGRFARGAVWSLIGALVAQGPIAELLAGSEGVIYLVRLKGETGALLEQVRSTPWVSGITVGEHAGETTWQVSVSDPANYVWLTGCVAVMPWQTLIWEPPSLKAPALMLSSGTRKDGPTGVGDPLMK